MNRRFVAFGSNFHFLLASRFLSRLHNQVILDGRFSVFSKADLVFLFFTTKFLA